jgi:hypothetical protein
VSLFFSLETPARAEQQLAAVRMLFDWLVIGQVVSTNPAAAVRGPKHVVKTRCSSTRRKWRREGPRTTELYDRPEAGSQDPTFAE